jgi:hypothetical protein
MHVNFNADPQLPIKLEIVKEHNQIVFGSVLNAMISMARDSPFNTTIIERSDTPQRQIDIVKEGKKCFVVYERDGAYSLFGLKYFNRKEYASHRLLITDLCKLIHSNGSVEEYYQQFFDSIKAYVDRVLPSLIINMTCESNLTFDKFIMSPYVRVDDDLASNYLIHCEIYQINIIIYGPSFL